MVIILLCCRNAQILVPRKQLVKIIIIIIERMVLIKYQHHHDYPGQENAETLGRSLEKITQIRFAFARLIFQLLPPDKHKSNLQMHFKLPLLLLFVKEKLGPGNISNLKQKVAIFPSKEHFYFFLKTTIAQQHSKYEPNNYSWSKIQI